MHVMIFGCGYSGKAIARSFAGPGVRISGTTRSTDNLASLKRLGIETFVFDGVEMEPSLREELKGVTHLVQSIAPGQDGDPAIRLIGSDLRGAMPKLKWIGYLSTVGVYGDHKGGWVNEETPCKPVSDRSVERIRAEQAWMELGGKKGEIAAAVLRLAGIYGPGRNAFCNLEKGTARRLIKKDQVFNRIRVEDIGAATAFLAAGNHGGIYNITDDEPCPPQDVVIEAARLMSVEPPPEQPFETAELTPMARSFYGENKRVSNRRIRDLGFVFAFPEYRMSLAQLWHSDTWRG
ncbi:MULTISPECIES: SDR family oxidoreductase [unclassified Sinorhizobium]|uniref:SDR family oxidoreductase n=1 Tax=unclassified Sinorhizobium TaxID=2613772 RepID=UPI0035265D7A